MLNILSFEQYGNIGNANVCETLGTDKGQFNLYREYIGGIDEKGGFDLYGAAGCIIGLYETSDITANEYREHTAINALFEILTGAGYDCRIDEEVYYISFPAISKSLIIENYSSEDETIQIVDTIKDYFKKAV